MVARAVLVASSGVGPSISAFIALIAPVGVAIGAVLLVRRLRTGWFTRSLAPGPVTTASIDGRAAAPNRTPTGPPRWNPDSQEPLGVGAARRLAAAAANWLVAGALIAMVVAIRHALIGWALIAGPFIVFTVGAALGAGVGELITGVRIIDTGTGGRLRLTLALARSSVQLIVSYAASMIALVIGLSGYRAVVAVIGARWTEGGAVTVGLGAALIAPPIAEAFFVRLTPRRNTPWDHAAGSAVAVRT